jgi:ferritin
MSKKELIPQEIVDLLNYRVNQEEHSSRIYYAMHEWLDGKGYFGAAKLIKRWSNEEMEHAGWARNFLESYDFLPEVKAIGSVTTEFISLTDVMQKAYRHEVDITMQCNDLATAIATANCWCAMPLAMKYMKEQTDELEKTSSWLDRLSLVGDDPRELMMIDREMGESYGNDSPMAKEY